MPIQKHTGPPPRDFSCSGPHCNLSLYGSFLSSQHFRPNGSFLGFVPILTADPIHCSVDGSPCSGSPRHLHTSTWIFFFFERASSPSFSTPSRAVFTDVIFSPLPLACNECRFRILRWTRILPTSRLALLCLFSRAWFRWRSPPLPFVLFFSRLARATLVSCAVHRLFFPLFCTTPFAGRAELPRPYFFYFFFFVPLPCFKNL